ncbi:arginyltransferase [Psychromonas sp. psych-6C06]|uniref:arginyltransferase n=1 Tax=Psychromonas sp. psych-6C06 TaxID=2058089 RepID=UPI000C325F53|nr:arginyltransferase [Psychromonas sp. psych-6C06]PKF62753.1 arginyltransferase [Psychromonas sp. psych-6C06]
MSTQSTSLNVGITKPFPCSYLADHQETLIMLIEPEINAKTYYPTLLANGFRRSGDQVYRPHCENCQACQSLRIPVSHFSPSRSQKRLTNKNKHFIIKIAKNTSAQYFSLYQRYISEVHADGPMFPPSKSQYDDFIQSQWNEALFIEIYDQEKLISVSITDQIQSATGIAWSAFYCFYDPDYQAFSLGKFAVLTQLRLANAHKIDWLYLGYYIASCQKMNYKTQFNPHQRFIDGDWKSFQS